ncbi:unnamed protein product, partial [Medioppia subpectinata]
SASSSSSSDSDSSSSSSSSSSSDSSDSESESPKKKANTNKSMGQFAAPHSQHTPTFPGTLPITQSYNQQLMNANLGPQVPQNQSSMFGNPSFNHPLPPTPGVAGGGASIIAKPPVVASHTSLPQQPQRPTATATAAPTRKNILSAPGPPLAPQPSQTTHKNPPVPLNSNSDSNQLSNTIRDSPKVNASHFTPPSLSTVNSGPFESYSSVSPANGEKKESSKSLSSTPSMSQSSPSVMSSNKKPNASESKGKNLGMGGWGALAKPTSGAGGSSVKPPSAENSFEMFRKQAKEKQDKQNQLKIQQEVRRKTQEREERERLRQEKERLREKEEDEALEKARKAQLQQIDEMNRNQSSNSSPASGSGSPGQGISQTERERLRQREKERRMREARAQQIDLNRQSEVMANFEEML